MELQDGLFLHGAYPLRLVCLHDFISIAPVKGRNRNLVTVLVNVLISSNCLVAKLVYALSSVRLKLFKVCSILLAILKFDSLGDFLLLFAFFL